MRENQPVRNVRYFFAELLILIIGISASFALNEYRVQKREQRQERELILSFKSNLINDSTSLNSGSGILEKQIESAEKILLLPTNAVYEDSLVFDLLTILSYFPFEPNDITYQEMRSVGNTHIIQNDSLLSEIISLYETDYNIVQTWGDIDGDHVKHKIIQFGIDNFPFAAGLNYSALSNEKKSQLMSQVTSDQYKYLIQFGLAYKSSTKAVLDQALKKIKNIISIIDEELAE